MTTSDFLEPDGSLSIEQIDNIAIRIDVDSVLYKDKIDLYVPPKMRNVLSEPTWENKMDVFGRIIQQHMN